MKRAYKLQDFVAHAGPVNCLKIGRKSSGVMVTGGEDKKVNMWAIGKPTAILSLAGHQFPVECVTFDCAEENVVAGSSAGTIKLWDLEEAKVVRSLTGHRSNCVAVDFHPFGEFFASGSSDTNLKVWDIRHKGCIQTYKGHTADVTHVRFSPDGRWLVSGSEDSRIKLWDLTAGKQLCELKQHDGPIRAIEFHPSEFLLATGSQDRWIKLWDLESFELVDSMGPDSTAVQALAFHSSGTSLVAACPDHIKMWGWEPCRAEDYVDVSWSSKVADVAVHESKVLGCTLRESSVSVWVVDLQSPPPRSPNTSASTACQPSPTRTAGGANRRGPSPSSPPQPSPSREPQHGPPPKTPIPAKMEAALTQDPLSRRQIQTAAPTSVKPPQAGPAPQAPYPSAALPSTAAPPRFNPHHLEPSLKDYPVTRDRVAVSNGEQVRRDRGSSAGRSRPGSGDASAPTTTPAAAYDPYLAKYQQPDLASLQPPSHHPAGPTSSHTPSSFQPEWEIHVPLPPPAQQVAHIRGAGGEERVEREEICHPEECDQSPEPSSSVNHKVSVGTGMGDSFAGGAFNPEVLRAAQLAVAAGIDTPLDLVPAMRQVQLNDHTSKPEPTHHRNKDRSSEIEPSHRRQPPWAGRREAPSDHRKENANGGDPRLERGGSPEVQVHVGGAGQGREGERRGAGGGGQANASSGDQHESSPGPLGLDFNAFLPHTGAPASAKSSLPSDSELLDKMTAPHSTVCSILIARLTNLQAIRGVWARGNTLATLEAVGRARDASVLVDFLEAAEDCPETQTLEMSAGLAPHLSELLHSEHSKYVTTSMRVAKGIVTAFGELIQSTRSASPFSVGVDLTAETRLERCAACYKNLVSLRPRLEVLMKRGGDVAVRAKDLFIHLDTLGP
eukprot:CAMPEP_0196573322 /NCGR_PEP_ID=MMETSP1081-20130531/3235_1 /TAXON_ID=36882 /ORGANISM="Pyramimonas amylifera, Strain CCMP720" /LENGTH=893 /DNA_ID=CAMNT_0041890983 /DNA_START=174 /DNA_END=2855 /DNA_ORIENTATION=-